MRSKIGKAAVVGVLLCGSMVWAKMDVKISESLLSVSCDHAGTVVAKVVAPDDTVVVNERYEGDTFVWTPSGMDGAYRYDVRVATPSAEGKKAGVWHSTDTVSDYAGGTVEVKNSNIKIASDVGIEE